MTLIRIAVGVDHSDLEAVDETDRVDPHLAIVVSIIDSLYGWSVEYPRCVLKSDPMPADVCGVFGRIPREPHP